MSEKMNTKNSNPVMKFLVFAALLICLPACFFLFDAFQLQTASPFELTATRIIDLNQTTEALIYATRTQAAIEQLSPTEVIIDAESAAATATQLAIILQPRMSPIHQTETMAVLELTPFVTPVPIDANGVALTSTALALVLDPPTETPDSSASLTPSPCPFTWGTNEDLRGAVRLTSYLVEQGYEVAVTVPAYGEYACEDFMLTDTSPRVTLVVDDLDDEVALGTIVRDVLLAIEAVEITRPHEVTIVFTLEGTEESVSWSVAYSDAIQLSIGSFRRLFRSGITLESD